MQKYINSVADKNGRPVTGASALVLNYPSGTTATIYSDNSLGPQSNPITTDSNGAFGFYAADGRYSVQISGNGLVTQTISDILLEDPTDGGSSAAYTSLTVGGSPAATSATLAVAGAAATVGSAGPSTVQADLNARPTSATLAASTGSTLVGGTWFGGVIATVSQLATSIGASLIGFIQAGVGAVVRSLQGKGRERISLLDFIPETEHAAIQGGTSTYDCLAAMQKAIASVGVSATSGQLAGPRIYAPYGMYTFSAPIELKRTVIIEGDAVGQAGAFATILQFPANSHGIICQRLNTTGSGIDSPSTTGGDASIIRNLQLNGTRSGSTSGYGIWRRARAEVDNVRITNFASHGIATIATSGGGGALEGNANNSHTRNCRISGCGGDGLYYSGADANAGMVDHVDASGNDGWGINDTSFLGNQFFACHTNGNGLRAQVSDGTNRYYTINAALAGTTTPGTDGTVWVLIGAGGVTSSYPLWVSGTTYLEGGAFQSTSNNSRAVFFGSYAESNQPPSNIIAPAMALGGFINNNGYRSASTGFALDSTTTRAKFSSFQINSRTDNTSSVVITPTFLGNPDEVMRVDLTGDGVNGMAFQTWDSSTGCWAVRHRRLTARTPVRYTTDLNTLTGGRSAVLGGGNVLFAQGLWVGKGTGVVRCITNDTAAPTSDEWAKGDLIMNSGVAASGSPGWLCTTSGTGGSTAVFKTMANVAA